MDVHIRTVSQDSEVRSEAQQQSPFVSGAEENPAVRLVTPPRIANADDDAALHTLFQMPVSLKTPSDALRSHPLGSAYQQQQQPPRGGVIPSVSSLNRDLNSLCLLVADLDDGRDRTEMAHGVRLSESTLNTRHELCRKSAPGALRDASRHTDQASMPVHNHGGTELTDLSAAPPLSCPRSIPTNLFEEASGSQPLSSAPPPLVRQTFFETNMCMGVESSVSADAFFSLSPMRNRSPLPSKGSSPKNDASAAGPLSRRLVEGATSKLPTQTPASAVAVRDMAVANGRGRSRGGRISVAVRKRPLAPGDLGVDCVRVHKEHIRIVATKQRVDLTTYEENSDYTFDSVFGEEATNQSVYADAVKDLLDVTLSGGRASCFAYGQTGSGKTYTMIGTDTEMGVYLQAAADLLERMRPGQHLCVSFFEIYCNSLYDLLNSRHPLVLREDANHRVNICGIVWRTVAALDELKELVQSGMEQRRTGATAANEHSSRSHAVLSFRIEDSTRPDSIGVMHFVDLAGSERAADTAAQDRLTRLEGAEINKSLLALKECIRALDEKKKHIPFRGSRLTEVLRDSFTGNCKTVMIAAVSPSSVDHEHTNNTLRYAFRVKGLSVPSVEPSKARNAPRIYRPVSRSRSSVGVVPSTSSPVSISAVQGCDVDRKLVNDARSRWKSHGARRRRHSGKKIHRTRFDSDTAEAVDDVTTMETAIEAQRARRYSTESSSPGRGHKRPAVVCGTAKSDLRCKTRQRKRTNGAPLLHAVPSICASSEFLLNTVTDADTKSRVPVEGVLPGVRGGASFLPVNTPLAQMTAEHRLKHQIIAQLRLDIGQQLEEVLAEKDAIISSLQQDNKHLRQKLDKALGRKQESDGVPHVLYLRQSSVPLPALPHLPSPRIFQDKSSLSGSLTCISEEVPPRGFPEKGLRKSVNEILQTRDQVLLPEAPVLVNAIEKGIGRSARGFSA